MLKRVIVLLAGLMLASLGMMGATTPINAATGLSPIHIQGNHLVDAGGHIVVLRGASRWSLEFSCGGDGHFAVTDFQAMKSWGMNVVRFPLNSGYWLGVGCNASAYQQLVKNAVSNAEAAGLYPVLVGQWSQHGSNSPMAYPEERGFFAQLATDFASDPLVSFVPVTEPHNVTWNEWYGGWNGGPGMAEIVSIFNAHAPGHIVWVNGLGWGNDMAFLTNGHAIVGPSIAYEVHIYQYWNPDPRLDMAHYVITGGEFGVNDANHDYVDAVMGYFDAHQTGYMAWAWASGQPELLLTSYPSTPMRSGRNVGGRVHDFIAAHAGTPTGTVPTPTATPSPTVTPSPTPKPPPAPGPNPPPPTAQCTYTVQAGDWLSRIGARLGVRWQDIATWSGLVNADRIYPGEVLRTCAPPSVTPPQSCIYVVQAGDWLSKIGPRVGAVWQDIARWSGLGNPDLIFPGEALALCPTSHGGYRSVQGVAEGQDSPDYTVQPGDTLSGIGTRYGASWRDLAAWSGIADPNRIFPGQVIHFHANSAPVMMAVNHPYVVSNAFPYGQCTWYAQKQARMAFWGNARDWLGYAQSHGYATGSQPVVGAVVVFQGGVQGASWLGHVAIVDAVLGGGRFRLREMNFYGFGGGWGVVSTRVAWTGWGVNFIYG